MHSQQQQQRKYLRQPRTGMVMYVWLKSTSQSNQLIRQMREKESNPIPSQNHQSVSLVIYDTW